MNISPETKAALNEQQDWIDAMEVLAKNILILQKVDLIIEGCIGGNEWCAYWLKKIFPQSVYVGADLAPAARTLNKGKIDEGINLDQYEQLLLGQDQLIDEEGNSSLVTFRANCLSPAFLASLREYSHAQTTMLVTFNGLVGLLGQDYVPGERKPHQDLTPLPLVAASTEFDVQLHLSESKHLAPLWKSPVNVVTRWYHSLEQAAQNLGKEVHRIPGGLIIFRDNC